MAAVSMVLFSIFGLWRKKESESVRLKGEKMAVREHVAKSLRNY